jgi:hypothetical protein
MGRMSAASSAIPQSKLDGGGSIQRLDDKIYPLTRATKEDEVVSNPDLDGLLEFLLGFAQEMLPAQIPFRPLGRL